MKEQLIKLAEEQGFEEDCLRICESISSEQYYIWMCKLQKWLRDIFETHVEVNVWRMNEEEALNNTSYKEAGSYYGGVVETKNGDAEDIEFLKSYEDSLERGLLEALKALQDEK